jgi:hypothetical protein
MSPRWSMTNLIGVAETEIRKKLSKHQLFALPSNYVPRRKDLKLTFSQYWRPLHYFPDFLAKTISILPSLEQKSLISHILFQELGEADSKKAHEVAFFEAMNEVGITQQTICSTSELPETAQLMELYRNSTTNVESALGVLFATEVADLAIIMGLHRIMKPLLVKDVPLWVELHVVQEPDHVNASVKTLIEASKNLDIQKIIDAAQNCAETWNLFFNAILIRQSYFTPSLQMENTL